jgi:hypothetical protein
MEGEFDKDATSFIRWSM